MQKKCFFLIFLLFFGWQFAWATPLVKHYQLNNGLNLFVKVDKRAPVAIFQVWYKVGSSYEPNGITGISHVLEHMMFQGTPNYPQGKFSSIVSSIGGQENAATSYDFTYYFQTVAAAELPISFKLEADRMHNLSLKQKNFKKEMRVVKEERRLRLDNNPQAVTFERYMATAFLANPYHHPVIGWMSDLQHMTDNDVKKWYDTWYAPNNAILVVVGDVVPEKIYQLAKKYFGSIPSKPLPTVKPHETVPQLSTRKVTVHMPAKVPFLIMGYNVPSINTAKKPWVPYALELAAYTLSGGNSARFPQYLIRDKQIASSATASYNPFARLSTLFTIAAIPAKHVDLMTLQKAILNQIDKLQTQLVSKAELDRIKTQLIAQKTYAKDSLAYQAQMIGALESVGINWKVGEDFVENISKITPAEIQTVAKKYFNPNRLTIASLIPEEKNAN